MKASSRWASKESPVPFAAPGRLPAPGGLGLESWRHPGELHLVAEQGAPNPAALRLVPSESGDWHGPGPAGAARSHGCGWRRASGRRRRAALCARPPARTGPTGHRRPRGSRECGGHDLDLVGRELALVEGLGQEGSLAAAVAAARRPLAAPARSPRAIPASPPPSRGHLWCSPRSRPPRGRTGPPPRRRPARPR